MTGVNQLGYLIFGTSPASGSDRIPSAITLSGANIGQLIRNAIVPNFVAKGYGNFVAVPRIGSGPGRPYLAPDIGSIRVSAHVIGPQTAPRREGMVPKSLARV